MKKRITGRGTPAVLMVALLAVSVVGCSTLDRALSMMQVGGTSSEAPSDTSQSSGDASQPSKSSQGTTSPGAALMSGYSPYQMQFYAIYALAAPFGGYKIGEAGYKPGQGTVWEFSGTGHAHDASTVEHALLKINSDGSQWWRVEVQSSDESLLYEFLLASNDTIAKVRYKDPENGQIMEFVPEQSGESQSQGSAAPVPQASDAERGKVKKDQQTIRVKAGTFRAEHATYSDEQNNYQSEVWTTTQVPGELVKFSTKNLKTGETSQGELVKIESGVTTVLQSF